MKPLPSRTHHSCQIHINQSIHPFIIHLQLCLPFNPPTCPYIHALIQPFTHPPTYPSFHPPTHSSSILPSIHPSTHLFTKPLIHPPIYSAIHPSSHSLIHPCIHHPSLHLPAHPSIHCLSYTQYFVGAGVSVACCLTGDVLCVGQVVSSKVSHMTEEMIDGRREGGRNLYPGFNHRWAKSACIAALMPSSMSATQGLKHHLKAFTCNDICRLLLASVISYKALQLFVFSVF